MRVELVRADRWKAVIGSRSMWVRIVLPTICLFIVAFGGYVKGTPLFAFLPFNITVVAACGVLVAGMQRVLATVRRYKGHAVGLILFLLATMMLGLIPHALNSYATGKRLDVLVVLPACLFAGLILLKSHTSRRVWLTATVIFGPLMILIALVAPSPLSDGALWPVGGSTIGVGRSAGAALVAMWGGFLVNGRSRTSLTLLPILVGGLILSGSRGPLAAALLAIVAMSALSTSRNRRLVLWAVIASIVALIGGMLVGLSAAERVTSLADASASIRFRLWELTFSLALEHPLLGIGWGNLYSYQKVSERLSTGFVQYPHNVALEVASEAGFIALGAFILAVLVAVRRQRQSARANGVELAVYGLLLFYLVNAMASGDIDSNRELWVAIGVCLGSRSSGRQSLRLQELKIKLVGPFTSTPGQERPLHPQRGARRWLPRRQR